MITPSIKDLIEKEENQISDEIPLKDSFNIDDSDNDEGNLEDDFVVISKKDLIIDSINSQIKVLP